MITIVKIKATVITRDGESFGFEFPFKKGLNILTGSNSSGKSSVLSSIYYCLGMEQLLGGYNADIFRDSLKNHFIYNNKTIYIRESYAELDIINKNGESATLKRHIKSVYNVPKDWVYIKEEKEYIGKYLHQVGDTDNEEGFYKWLLTFLEIKLPIYKDKSGKEKKVLYLQYIFAIAFVEQTRGWSDFFAVLPNWGSISKPKERIIEYTLNLGNLLNEFKIEDLKDREKIYREKWTNELKGFNIIAYYSGVDVPGLNDKFTKVYEPKIIAKFKLKRRKNTGEIIDISELIERLKIDLKKIKDENNKLPNPNNDNTELLQKQKQLSQIIIKLNRELNKIHLEQVNENRKRFNYEKRLKEIEKELSVLESAKKIDAHFSELNINKVEYCPVCNSPLKNKGITHLNSKEKISSTESILFYKSEKSLYASYLKNSDKLMERFEKTITYYNNRIREKKYLLNNINKDLVEDSRIPSRENIAKEIQIESELKNINRIMQEFSALKDNLTKFSIELFKIIDEIKALKKHDVSDDRKINDFKNQFIELLKLFSYPREVYTRIQIEKGKLLPFIREANRSTQVIRSKASASDFIRALWSFYLGLLMNGKSHLGLLILDEPGQHAMKLKDMRTLIELTSQMKEQQVILAISQDKKDNREYIFDELLEGFTSQIDYNINVINDNDREDKSIQPMNN